MRTFITALAVTTVLTIVTGIIYPLAMWGIAHDDFPGAGGRQLDNREQQGRGLELYRTEFCVAAIFSEPAVRRR